MTSTSSDRFYKLLGDLSPDLLADAFPEAESTHNATSFRARHAKRIGRMILLYAACAVLLVGAIWLLPKLWNEKPIVDPPVTDSPVPTETVPWEKPPEGFPDDYFRPDLVWSNEYFYPYMSNMVSGQYYSIDFRFVDDENALYAVYLADSSENPLSCQDELSSSKAGWQLLHTDATHYRLRAANPMVYYAATRKQIEIFCEYIEQSRASSNSPVHVNICLGHQVVAPLFVNGTWNPDALSAAINPSQLDCVVGATDTPYVAIGKPTSMQLTYRLNESKPCRPTMNHVLIPDSSDCNLQVYLGQQWYTVPPKRAIYPPDWISDLETTESVSFDFLLNESMYGRLPTGKYRIVKPVSVSHIQLGFESAIVEDGGCVAIQFTIYEPLDEFKHLTEDGEWNTELLPKALLEKGDSCIKGKALNPELDLSQSRTLQIELQFSEHNRCMNLLEHSYVADPYEICIQVYVNKEWYTIPQSVERYPGSDLPYLSITREDLPLTMEYVLDEKIYADLPPGRYRALIQCKGHDLNGRLNRGYDGAIYVEFTIVPPAN
jgi:hypothetical protein